MQDLLQGKWQSIATSVGAIALLWCLNKRKSSKRNGIPVGPNDIVVPLLNLEASRAMMKTIESPSSLTWYEGDIHKAKLSIRQRLTKILVANPWLAGRLATQHETTVLVFSSNKENLLQYLDTIFQDNTDQRVQLSRDTPYKDINAAIEPLCAKKGVKLLNQKDEPIFRVSLIPDYKQPKKRFALITSICHCVGDGHTYYTLHNMLGKDQPIVALKTQRKHEVVNRIETALGGRAHALAITEPNAGFKFRYIYAAIRSKLLGRPPLKLQIFYMNDLWINEQKQKAEQKHDANFFVSANDILTSHFFQCTDCDQGLMAVNFRNKVDDCFDSDAGNYFNCLQCRPNDYESPSQIRAIVNQLKHGAARDNLTNPMSSWEYLLSRKLYGVITNWTSFLVPVKIDNCTQELHVPVLSLNSLSCPPNFVSLLVVFKPDVSNKVAALFAGHPKVWENIEASGMAGKPIN